MIKIRVPEQNYELKELKAGDIISLSGIILTARDQAHKLIVEQKNDIVKDKIIFYTGPSPKKDGLAIGSCGPTTAGRMDPFYQDMAELGMVGSIGKGPRSDMVIETTKKHGMVYFIIPGGLGALTSLSIKKADPIMYTELGPEAVYQLEVEDLELIVGIDSLGNSITKKRVN